MPLTPTRKIWMDREFVDWDAATVHVLTPTLHYGWGVYEGIRAYATSRGPAVFRLGDHVDRLFRSAAVYLMNLDVTPEEIAAAVKATVAVNELDSCYVRPLVYLAAGEIGLNPLPSPARAMVAAWRWGRYLGEEASERGCRAVISGWQHIGPNSIPPTAKGTGQYVNSSLAKASACKAGYDEAILLNPQGNVVQGTGENIFAVSDGALITPPVHEGLLAGITRDTVMTLARDLGYEVRERPMVRTDLYYAAEAFFTGTAAEVVPIVEVDDRPVGAGTPGPITAELRELYGDVVRGRVDRYKHWNDYLDD